MKNTQLIIDKSLNSKTKLYRYIKLSCFFELMETHSMYLTNLNSWDDLWELPARERMPAEFKDMFYGQCWSLEGISDALWKIYAKDKEGILIQSSVEKFYNIQGIKLGKLSPVIYYENLDLAINKTNTLQGIDRIFYHGLLKRKAFKHEKEVRLLTLNTETCIDNTCKKHCSTLLVKVDPFNFIEDIFIDPRASNWFVNTFKIYCKRLNLHITPKKSDLF